MLNVIGRIAVSVTVLVVTFVILDQVRERDLVNKAIDKLNK